MKQCLFTFILLFFAVKSFAQQREFIFKNYTQEEGLPSNETYFIFEDSRHYLWVATDLGVVRYNGNKFELFNLPDNVVFRISEDNKGRIWFFTHKAQLAYFENEKMNLYKYNDAIARRINRIQITDAYIDKTEKIILNSALDSNYTISPDGIITGINHFSFTYSKSIFQIDVFKKDICFTQRISSSVYKADSAIFIITKGNHHFNYSIPIKHALTTHSGSVTSDTRDVYFFTGKMLVRLKEDGSYMTKEMPYEILSLCINNKYLWVGMNKGGAVILDTNLHQKSSDIILLNKSITSITKDYEGGIWLSSLENGIFFIKNKNIQHVTNNNSPNTAVSRLLNINDSILLFTTPFGIYKIDNNNKSTEFLQLQNLNTSDLLINKKGVIFYLGAIDNVNKIIKKNDPNFKFIYILASPSSEAILQNTNTIIYSRSNSIVSYKSCFLDNNHYSPSFDTGFFNWKTLLHKPAKLFYGKNNIIWGGTNDGLYRTSTANDTMIKFSASSPLLNKGISCIRQMENGTLVAGIRFGGIALIRDTNIIANITEKEGILSDKIRYLLPLKNQLWIATAKGISVIRFTSYNPLQYTITNIGKNEGFYNITINQLIQYKGNIVAATNNGMYFIENPEEFLNKRFPPIPFYINRISYFKGDTSGINKISIPYSKNSLLIKYKAISFNSAEEIKYFYRFKGRDSAWHSTSSNELLLENLEPGNYNLQLKAEIQSQQRYSGIQTLYITINKPWWQNNWFRLLAFLLIAGSLYIYISSRIKKIRREEEKKTEMNARIAELENTALRSQMNPHFIFNCLSSIQQLIVSGNKTEANEYLVKFSRLIRKTLELSSSPFISIREEIEYLNEYLTMEKLRLSGQFNYSVVADKNIDTDKIQIPNMMIQPVIENSIRHGIKPMKNKNGVITIKFKYYEKYISCTVKDNGIGRVNAVLSNKKSFTEHKSYGIDIIRQRLKALRESNEMEMRIKIDDILDTNGSSAGTEVTIQLPFKQK